MVSGESVDRRASLSRDAVVARQQDDGADDDALVAVVVDEAT